MQCPLKNIAHLICSAGLNTKICDFLQVDKVRLIKFHNICKEMWISPPTIKKILRYNYINTICQYWSLFFNEWKFGLLTLKIRLIIVFHFCDEMGISPLWTIHKGENGSQDDIPLCGHAPCILRQKDGGKLNKVIGGQD